MALYNDGVFISPIARDPSEIPEISLGNYLLARLRINLPRLKGRTWVHDTLSDSHVKFDEIEDLSRRLGSALTRLGFKKGDTLFYVTFNVTHLHVLCLAVWRLGGITRGWYQHDPKDVYTSQIRKSRAKFVLFDEKTAPVLQDVDADIDWPLNFLCFGNVDLATSVNQLLQDDGSAFPKHVQINPREDVVATTSTSGTTGEPKGILHSHYTAIAAIHGWREYFINNNSVLSSAVNFSGSNFLLITDSLCSGGTVYTVPKFNKNTYFELLQKYKPEGVILYPYAATWFARLPQLKTSDLSFLKTFHVTASRLDAGTVRILSESLPHVIFDQACGTSECMLISTTKLGPNPKYPLISKMGKGNENEIVSTGKLVPYMKAKVINTETGRTLKPGEQGEILVKGPSVMLGYLREDMKKPDRENIDGDDWMRTGDLGFIDADGNMFVIERISTFFKYNATPVAPSEIEALLQEHHAVQAAGVVAIPNVATDNLTRAFVVLRPGCLVTADELQVHVAARLPEHKHLHGGVRFIDVLPVNRNAKLDRAALKKIALAENNN
ncbi:hypothetical protein B566_EDAN007418 [Ephemera danica]|nr:hypothetical protein B566_EDAN007418 [Ephemera danica]